MKRNETILRLQEIFRDIFDDDNLVINENTTNLDIEDWDSMYSVILISTIEEEFGIKFKIKDLRELSTVKGLLDNIK